MFKKYLFIVIALSCFLTGKTQDFNFKHYGQKQGLANASVKCIFQDSYGYIWFATQGGGISKFDGTTFTNYDKQDGLVGNDVLCIAEDRDKNIWIGTMDGASKFDRTKFTNYSTENGLKENKVYGILCDEDKTWFSTYGGGIAILEHNHFSYLNTTNGLSSDKVFSVYKDKQQQYWIGTKKGGIAIYNGKSFKVIKETEGFNSASAFCFYEGSDGKLWIGTPGKGIFYVEENQFHHFDTSTIKSDYVSSIIEDTQHNIWCATDEHGLLKIKSNLSNQIFNEQNGLKGVNITSVICDYEGNIWVSSFGNGVQKLTNEAFSVYTKQHGLSENRVIAFCKKLDGFLFSTSNGLNYFEEGLIQAVNLPKELKGSHISSLFYEDKLLYVGTDNQGVFILSEASKHDFSVAKQHISKIDSVKLETVVTSIQKNINSNSIWFNLYGAGIAKTSNGHIDLYSTKKSALPSNDVISIYLKSNDLWIGSIGKGLMKLNTLNNQLTTYSVKEGLSSKNIFSINEFKSHVAVGSMDEGLFILDQNGHFVNITEKQGLLSNTINSIQTSDSGELWLGTDLGINKITLNKDFTLKSIRSYTEEDGLKSTAIEQNASLEQNGLMYFGTSEGLVVYNAKEDIVSHVKPKVLITDVLFKYAKIDTTKIAYSGISKLNLPLNPVFNYKQNDITFKFKALSTRTQQYQFLLEGYDKEWSPVQSANEAIFTNLSPGKYIFKLKAINKYAVESDVLEYAFEITPPFYMRWWFFVVSIFIIVAGFVTFIKYRTHKLIKEKNILESKVTERTTELKSANSNLNAAINEIKDSINYAERIQSSILPNLEIIKEHLPNSFILFKPRDIVSGDFYWFNQVDGKLFFATVDCTGHGVPGAFMSMIGNSLLNEIILTQKIESPSAILSSLNQSIFKILKQNTSQSKDGMDMALCVIDLEANTLTYSGANRELLLIRNGELIEYKPTKSAIGGFTDSDTIFAETIISIKPNDLFYTTTDGYADQFGGEKGKKLMTKNFKEFLLQIHTLPMPQQYDQLQVKISDWMGNTYAQVDDILIVGIKF